MKIMQNKNTGDGVIKFTDQEAKIINDKKELSISVKEMGPFAKSLMHVAMLLFQKYDDVIEKEEKENPNFKPSD